MSKEKTKRNNDIFARRFRDKASYKDISKEFGITVTRVRQIIEQVRIDRRKEYKPVYKIDQACKILGASSITRGRIYNALFDQGYLKNNRWMHLGEDDLLHINNLGTKCVNILLKAQTL